MGEEILDKSEKEEEPGKDKKDKEYHDSNADVPG